MVVAEFRDPIYPGLVSTGTVERGGDKPFHTVVNAENFHSLQLLLYTHEGKVDAIYSMNFRERALLGVVVLTLLLAGGSLAAGARFARADPMLPDTTGGVMPEPPPSAYPPSFGDPSAAPPGGFEWRPGGTPGVDPGGYYNSGTDETWSPNLGHDDPIGEHWDYIEPYGRHKWRWYRDGSWECVY